MNELMELQIYFLGGVVDSIQADTDKCKDFQIWMIDENRGEVFVVTDIFSQKHIYARKGVACLKEVRC